MTTTKSLMPLLAATLLLSGCPTDGAGNNQAPEILVDVPATLDYVVGSAPMKITVTADDPEGQSVTIGMANPPPRATFQEYTGWGVFSWDPLASDVTPPDQPLNLIFTATDAVGGASERVVSVLIRAGNGIPRFENSPSVLYNTDSNKPLAFEVRVRDDDSQRVAIAMPSERAPAGSGFVPNADGFSGRFEWMPTEQQREFRVHSVTFTADDGQNPTVTQKVSILFKKGGGGGEEETRPDVPDNPTDPTECPPFEMQVLHTPLPAQHGPNDYTIAATLSAQAAARYDRLVLNWSDQDVFNDFEVQKEGTEMTNDNGTFTATIPNPLLAAGQSKVYYYEICALDDDTTEDDAILCGPSTIYYSFIAYSPQDSSCADDGGSNSSFDAALDLELTHGWEHHRVCTPTSDYYRMDLEPYQNADIFFTYPFGSGTTVELFDGSMSPLPLPASTCAGFVYHYVENQTDQPTTRFFKVSGNDAPYQVSPFYFSPSSMCAPTDVEPNDTSLSATLIPADGTTSDMQEICGAADVDVFRFAVTQGQRITANVLFSNADGDLDAKLFAPSQASDVSPSGTGVASGLSFSDNETLEHIAQETGEYFLLVRGYLSGNTYTVNVVAEDPPATCMDDDAFGDNHTEATAAQAGAFVTHADLDVCPGADDWYSFIGFAGEFIDVLIDVQSGDPAAVGVSAFLDGFPEETGSLNGNQIMLSIEVFDDATYHLQVTTTSPVVYDMNILPITL